jgi:hypothetical protein
MIFAASLTGQGKGKLHRYEINRQNTSGARTLSIKHSGPFHIIITPVSKKGVEL